MIDPITFSVMLGRFDAIVNEMTLHTRADGVDVDPRNLPDFSCAIYDAVPRARSRCSTRCRSTRPRCTSCSRRSRARSRRDQRRRRLPLQRPYSAQHPRRRPRDRVPGVRRRTPSASGRSRRATSSTPARSSPPASPRGRERLAGGDPDPAAAGFRAGASSATTCSSCTSPTCATASSFTATCSRSSRRSRRDASGSSSSVRNTESTKCSRHVDAIIDYADRRMSAAAPCDAGRRVPRAGVGRLRRS